MTFKGHQGASSKGKLPPNDHVRCRSEAPGSHISNSASFYSLPLIRQLQPAVRRSVPTLVLPYLLCLHCTISALIGNNSTCLTD